ncbi:MAG: 50S ribosomal protein L29 [Candidatus Pacebacteria bacterium]|jgi:ribosomal protein L29|nr:50S ribosomal protein L29 [Parcubacteria group bacterium]MDP6249675.1 50S ribosomal protein L29 [Candidatus Paceibacterota bacterium]MDP7159344.1 50S ribosomal protein L29 [Candidatus Paceibacterota bacterium]MDP7368416.1 50S ribosomal protein L29 [Candidatus Paceibacterota bacterium]MDP7466349.1 50S ribosomal protein L29 [Candidatus Paceibacterota bacterium]|tara:strand:+ start:589 stop:777 length:189 start_codon:yes stop_codon:yes gene_type:complete
MKAIKSKNEKELMKEVKEKREKLRAFRFGIAGSKVRNVKEGKNLKREVAQILTEVNARKNKK